jgi:hypothetical protein
MKSALSELNKAIFEATQNLSFSVYDCVPEKVDFPYGDISEMLGADESNKNHSGESLLLTAHLWSEYKGTKEVREMVSDFIEALTESNLTMNSFTCQLKNLELTEILNDPDGQTRHGIVKIRFFVTQN